MFDSRTEGRKSLFSFCYFSEFFRNCVNLTIGIHGGSDQTTKYIISPLQYITPNLKIIMSLTKEQLEPIVKLLQSHAFEIAYLLEMGHKLENAEQAVDAILNKKVTLEDMFFARLDSLFKEESYEISETWEDNMERFEFENYFPTNKVLPEGGAWIKIRNESGYQLHFAKTSTRKLDPTIEAIKIGKKMKTEKSLDKIKQLKRELDILVVHNVIGIDLYEIRYQRTKTKVEYLNPYQYEICNEDELQLILDAVRKKTFGVKMRNLYTSINKDQIFYLRSRGISEQEAMTMANLKQCFFDVDIVGMSHEYIKPV